MNETKMVTIDADKLLAELNQPSGEGGEAELDAALKRIYEVYGNDLEAFFRDAKAASKKKARHKDARTLELETQIATLKAKCEYERTWKDTNYALAAKLQETVEALAKGKSEAEAQLAVKDSTISDLRDADKRAVKIAAGQVEEVKRELEAQLKEATSCGLCGERPTDENRLFICCENCTDIGVSNVPKEVFELQRQLKEETELVRKLNGDVSVADATIADLKALMAEWKATAAAENTKLLRQREAAEAQLVEAQSLRQDANAAFQAMRETGLMAGTRPVTLLNLTTKLINRAEKAEAHAAALKEENERLRKVVEVYGHKSMWIGYKRDGEITASIFIGNENGLEDGVMCDGWRFAQAALRAEVEVEE